MTFWKTFLNSPSVTSPGFGEHARSSAYIWAIMTIGVPSSYPKAPRTKVVSPRAANRRKILAIRDFTVCRRRQSDSNSEELCEEDRNTPPSMGAADTTFIKYGETYS